MAERDNDDLMELIPSTVSKIEMNSISNGENDEKVQQEKKNNVKSNRPRTKHQNLNIFIEENKFTSQEPFNENNNKENNKNNNNENNNNDNNNNNENNNNKKKKENINTSKPSKIKRDSKQDIIFPIQISGGVSILSLGSFLNSHFCNKKYLYPVDFTSRKTINGILFESQIKNNDDKVQFSVSKLISIDNEKEQKKNENLKMKIEEEWTADSPTRAWQQALEKTSNRTTHNISGPEYFGLTNSEIVQEIEKLPEAHLCVVYQKEKASRNTSDNQDKSPTPNKKRKKENDDQSVLSPKKLEKQKEKEEKEQKRREEQEKKQKEKEEKAKKLEEEKRKKEEEKRKKEEERQKQKEEKAKKLEEEKQKKEEEKRKKEEERQKQKEEKSKKLEEEKQKKEEERKKKEEKKVQSTTLFDLKISFKKENLPNLDPPPSLPIFLTRYRCSQSTLDDIFKSDTPQDIDFLFQECKNQMKLCKKETREKKKKIDDQILQISGGSGLNKEEIKEGKKEVSSNIQKEYSLPPHVRGQRMKLIHFYDNYRPAYYGTFSKKKITVLTGKNGLKKKDPVFDYEVDSDDEWEEPEEGEDILNSENEEEDNDEDNDEEDDKFVVKDGYFSEDEGVEITISKGQETDPSQIRLESITTGPVWNISSLSTEDQEKLLSLVAQPLYPFNLPFDFNKEYISEKTTTQISTPKRNEKVLEENFIKDFVKFVHGSEKGIEKLIEEFKENFPTQASKSHLQKRLQSVAKKEKYDKNRWVVSQSLLQQYQIPDCLSGMIKKEPKVKTPTKKTFSEISTKKLSSETPTKKPSDSASIEKFFLSTNQNQ